MFNTFKEWFRNLSVPKPTKYDQIHKKKYYDLDTIQAKLGITQEQVDKAWSKRKPPEPVFLVRSEFLENHFISTYEE